MYIMKKIVAAMISATMLLQTAGAVFADSEGLNVKDIRVENDKGISESYLFDDLYVKADVENKSADSPYDMDLIYALYNDGVLISTKKTTVTINPGDNQDVVLSISNPEGAKQLKVFSWDSVKGLVPLHDTVSLKTLYVPDTVESRIASGNTDPIAVMSMGDKIIAYGAFEDDGLHNLFSMSVYDSNDKLLSMVQADRELRNGIYEVETYVHDIPENYKVKVNSNAFEYMRVSNVDKSETEVYNEGESDDERQVYFVSTGAKSVKDGSAENPFATLQEAANAIKAYKAKNGLPPKGFVVYVRGGVYEYENTYALQMFDDKKGCFDGTEEAPIVFQGYPGEEVILTHGKNVPLKSARVVDDPNLLARMRPEAKGKIMELDISGFENEFSIGDPKASEPVPFVSIDGNNLNLSRYPNGSDYDLFYRAVKYDTKEEITKVSENIDYLNTLAANAKAANGIGLGLEDDTHSLSADMKQRVNNWNTAKNAWLCGYWGFNYNYDVVKFAGVATTDKSHTALLGSGQTFTAPKSGGLRYAIYNLLEETDVPGEWYVDAANKKLYFYPPESFNKNTSKLTVSGDDNFANAFVIMSGVKNIQIRDFTFENTNAYAVYVNPATNLVLDGIKIRNVGAATSAVYLRGQGCVIRNCELSECSAAGVELYGNTVISGCSFHDYGKYLKHQQPAIFLSGENAVVKNNKFYNAPHLAIKLGGSFNKISNNEFYNISTEAVDSGAIYYGRTLLGRENVISNNYFHDIIAPDVVYDDSKVWAVYFDDCWSGNYVVSNMFENCDGVLFSHGGSSNTFEGNYVINCAGHQFDKNYSVRFASAAGQPSMATDLINFVEGASYDASVWDNVAHFKDVYNLAKQYQNSTISFAEFIKPRWNVSRNNIFSNSCPESYEESVKTYGTVENNVQNNSITAQNSGFDFSKIGPQLNSVAAIN